MEMLDKLVIPVEGSHLALLQYALIAALLIFATYSSVLFGSTLLSVIYRRRGNKSGDNNLKLYSNELIDLATSTPTIWFGLGIMPLVSIILTYAQLLSGSGTSVTTYLFFGFLLYTSGLILVYTYKNSLKNNTFFSKIKGDVKNKDVAKEYAEYTHELDGAGGSSAFWAVTLLFLGIWMILGAMSQAVDASLSNIFEVMFSSYTLLKLVYFIVSAITLTGASYIYFNYQWGGGKDYSNKEFASFALRKSKLLTLSVAVFQPLFWAFMLISVPEGAISSWLFGLSVIGGIMVLIFSHFIYAMLREESLSRIKFGYWIILFAFFIATYTEQMAFRTSNSEKVAVMAHHYEVNVASLHGEVEEIVYDGKATYKTLCSSCHKFDVAGAGPAYNDVLPKYATDKDAMYSFIMKPTPQNPADFPGGMPNPRLKPGQAKAVIDYLLGEVKKD